jgi:hypothetical protein
MKSSDPLESFIPKLNFSVFGSKAKIWKAKEDLRSLFSGDCTSPVLMLMMYSGVISF